MDFGLLLLDNSIELVDADAGFLKVLVGHVCLSTYCGGEAIGHSACSGVEVFSVLHHAEDSFGCAG